ncbi:Hcp family type VI secretion system effector [Roseateles violae]|uniref:Type VI secretion system tube protein Hcp n=1 Tax=Roseateles violae TaxID=3058042 RepID=A0ABT8DTM0_9BURK|nr:type VI secretion system tube protein Hcp [Pelomonas sp. PFR6]MDN3921348.1 type VI secretion system tube protein Hcp [Pelomonas sp. PFR6]
MKRFLLPLALGLALLAGPAAAANDLFLKIEGINGESTDKAHLRWIDALSFSWGVSNSYGGVIGGAGSGAGKASFSDLSWMQFVDSSTVPIFFGVASGKVYPKATLDVVHPGEDMSRPFFQMIFDEANLSSLQVSGSSETPVASASLLAQKITMNYWQQDDKGNRKLISAYWDLSKAKGGFSGDPQALTGLLLSGGSIGALADLPIPSAVPEPQTWVLLALGLAILGRRVRWQRTPT